MTTRNKPDQPGAPENGQSVSKDVELLHVLVARAGKQVSAQWGMHPQLKLDLKPDELKEVTELMAKVTNIVATRFSEVLAEAEPDKPGTA